MNYQQSLADILAHILAAPPFSLTKSAAEFTTVMEIPKESKLGDYAFPSFILARDLRLAPPEIAKRLVEALNLQLSDISFLEKIEAVGGYVNFFLKKSALAEALIPQILDGIFLQPRSSHPDKVMIEYSQPNTHKAFHVGHIRCAALGDSLSRVFQWMGHEVVPVNYLGDEGTHVARCLWYYLNHYRGEAPTSNKGEFLGILYTKSVDMVELGGLTEAPYPGVAVAKVRSAVAHPAKPEWIVLTLETKEGEKSVVTAARGVFSGDSVAYVKSGMRFAGRTIGTVTKSGVVSEGMVLSQKELGLSDNNDLLAVISKSASIGDEVAELYRIPGAVPDGTPVLVEWERRNQGVSEILKRLESQDPEMKRIWEETKQWSMEELHEIYQWLDCRFDRDFFESEFGEAGKEIVREFQQKGVFVESEGAVGADLSKDKLGFCLLIKRDGTALYATRDLALARKKFEEFGVQRSIYVVDSAQTLHFQQVFKCLELMGFPQASACHHVAYAQVVRPDGKMSSRKGNVILFSELKDRLLDKINKEFLVKYTDEWSKEEIASTAHLIALATMRYGMLNQDNNSLVVFDLDEWSARSGNTGPYMLYAHARINSILREFDQKLSPQKVQWNLLTHESEGELLSLLAAYPDAIEKAAKNYTLNGICQYVYELSKRFNRFYHDCSVAYAETEELKMARACLVSGVGRVIGHGLGLLGIQTVPRM